MDEATTRSAAVQVTLKMDTNAKKKFIYSLLFVIYQVLVISKKTDFVIEK